MENKMIIPLHLSVTYGGEHHNDDTVEHEVRFRVANHSDSSHTVAIVQSDAHANPRVLRYLKVGDFKLPQPVLDQVVIACFKQLISQMMKLEGNSAEVWMADGAEWLRLRLSKEDADLTIAAMSHHVDLAVRVPNLTWVKQE